MIRPRRRIILRKVAPPILTESTTDISKPPHEPPNCDFCGIELPDMLDLCLRINGFRQKYLCTPCGYYMEDNQQGINLSPASNTIDNSDDAVSLLNSQHIHPEIQKDDDASVKCRLCPNTFESIAIRNQHQKAAHRNPLTAAFKCPFCALEMKQISNLEVHVMRHTGSLPATCEICGKGFAHAAFLQKHMRSHSGDREFVCQVCDKGFKYKHGLVQHQLLHTNERPFACEVCPKTYRDLSDLRRHKYSHGGVEKRFQCVVCHKQFFENKWLRQHMRIHEKQIG